MLIISSRHYERLFVLMWPVQLLWWQMIYPAVELFLQKDCGLFSTLIYHCGASVDGALLKENYITVGQLITPI